MSKKDIRQAKKAYAGTPRHSSGTRILLNQRTVNTPTNRPRNLATPLHLSVAASRVHSQPPPRPLMPVEIRRNPQRDIYFDLVSYPELVEGFYQEKK
ncbi:MAG: hypothetical protein WCP97_09815, partial [bacterium]